MHVPGDLALDLKIDRRFDIAGDGDPGPNHGHVHARGFPVCTRFHAARLPGAAHRPQCPRRRRREGQHTAGKSRHNVSILPLPGGLAKEKVPILNQVPKSGQFWN